VAAGFQSPDMVPGMLAEMLQVGIREMVDRETEAY
jgi:hypothetical protein